MFPVPRSSSSPYSLPWTFKLFSIAIPRPLTRLIFSFLMHFFPPNDLWTARFVVGFVANQKVITPWSVFLFFFSFFRKISFLGSSCRCSKSLAMMDWRKSSWIIFVDETSRYSSLSSSVLQFDDVRLFHRFLYYRVLRMAKYGVPGSNIFSFFSASGNLPLSQMYMRTRKRDWKRLANNFSFRKITSPLRIWNRRETGGKTGDFRERERRGRNCFSEMGNHRGRERIRGQLRLFSRVLDANLGRGGDSRENVSKFEWLTDDVISTFFRR